MIISHEPAWVRGTEGLPSPNKDPQGKTRAPVRLHNPIESDVVIVGGGYTGLWTAYFLSTLAPKLRIVLLEAQHCGAGASGRNGGWLMGSLEGLGQYQTNQHDTLPASLLSELRALIPSLFAITEQEGISCDLNHGGAIFAAARHPQQLPRAQAFLKEQQSLGFDAEDYRWLEADALTSRINTHKALGGVYTPHVATLNPWLLIKGLARVVATKGVEIYENTPATQIAQGNVVTPDGRVRADHIVIATEGYSGTTSPLNRALLPVQSGMVATEPLSESQWSNIGFRQREAFCDFSRQSTYLQRTADNRLVIGARGRYQAQGHQLGNLPPRPQDTAKRQRLARDLFPMIETVRFTHAWSGTLAVPRNFHPQIVFDQERGISTAGGYLGEGVGASFLFGRTLAELICGQHSVRTEMPWVRKGAMATALRRWEPEPLPWLGFNATMALYDGEERALKSRPDGVLAHLLQGVCDLSDRLLHRS